MQDYSFKNKVIDLHSVKTGSPKCLWVFVDNWFTWPHLKRASTDDSKWEEPKQLLRDGCLA